MTLTHPMFRSGPRRWSHCLAAAVLALVAHASLAQELPAARPEELGLANAHGQFCFFNLHYSQRHNDLDDPYVHSVINIANEALILAVLVSAPVVGAAAVIGLLFGFLQALTQLQDQTTTFAIKLVVVLGLMLVLMPWLGALCYGYAERVFTLILDVR